MKQTRIFITFSLLVLLSTAASSFAYYDTQVGRFLQRDPLGINPAGGKKNRIQALLQYKDGMNLYEYVRSQPTIKLDPTGLYSWCGSVCPDGWLDERPTPGRNSWSFPQALAHWMLRRGTTVTVSAQSDVMRNFAGSSNGPFNRYVGPKIVEQLKSVAKGMCPGSCKKKTLTGSAANDYHYQYGSYPLNWLVGSGHGNDRAYSRWTYLARCCLYKTCCGNGGHSRSNRAFVAVKCQVRNKVKDKFQFDDYPEWDDIWGGTDFWHAFYYYKKYTSGFHVDCN